MHMTTTLIHLMHCIHQYQLNARLNGTVLQCELMVKITSQVHSHVHHIQHFQLIHIIHHNTNSPYASYSNTLSTPAAAKGDKF